MAFKVVYTAEEFLNRQFDLADNHGTDYDNHYPKNLLYRKAFDLYTADCWNEIKAQIWGFDPNEPIGTYVKQNPETGLGDWNGWTILQCCSGISKDLTTCIPAEFLLSTNRGHAGTFIGETVRNGKTYNVLEMTADWEHKFQYSYMDTKTGYRYEYKGAPKRMKTVWGWHGKLPWIDYSKDEDVLAVDGWWGMATTRYTQKMFGTPIDGIISRQNRANKKYLPNASTNSWEFVTFRVSGSDVIKALQKLIGTDPDGDFGAKSVTALERFLKAKGFYDGEIEADLGKRPSMGEGLVKAWQRYVNAYFRA